MGKYGNLARSCKKVPLSNRAIVDKWDRLIRGGIVKPPVFWDALQAVPPPMRPFAGNKPEKIMFPEDELVRVYMKRNPDWKNEVYKGHHTARQKDIKSRAHLFVSQWQRYIEEGMDKEQAYTKTDEEFKAVEGYKQKQMEDEVELLVKGKHPGVNAWLEEEEIYVQQAYDHHKKEWETKQRAKQIEADFKKQAEIAQAEAKIRDAEDAKIAKEAAKLKKQEKAQADKERAAKKKA